jgi:ribonuclease inhibitor
MLLKRAMVVVVGLFFSLQAFATGTVLINGKEIKTRDQLHMLVAKQLKFPGYYAKTLDSLYDILSTDLNGDSIIKFKHLNILKARLGSEYVEDFVQTIMDAAEDNNRVIILLE